MLRAVQMLMLVLALMTGTGLMSGCSSRKEEAPVYTADPGEGRPYSRPARPMEEERTLGEKTGEVVFIILGIGAAVGLAVLSYLAISGNL